MSKSIRWSLWLFALALFAVVVALAGRYGSGYVVMVMPPWRVELSVMLFAIIIAVAFAATYAFLRFAGWVYRLRRVLRAKRKERQRNKSRIALYSSLKSLFSGQFRLAEQYARGAMSANEAHDGTRDLAAAVAAWAAHEGGNSDAAVPYLERIRSAGASEMRDASKAYMRSCALLAGYIACDAYCAQSAKIASEINHALPCTPA